MRLILARHGETQLNKDGRIQGITGLPLNDTGLAQARHIARALEPDIPFVLYSSPIDRARQTAQVIADTHGLPLTQLDGLVEADAGDLEGLTGQEMRERFPEFTQRWSENSATTRMPGGESLQDVQHRSWTAITGLMDRHADDTVVAVTHNFTILTIVCRVLELPIHSRRRLQQDLGSLTRLDLTDSQMVVLSLNETWHLRTETSSR